MALTIASTAKEVVSAVIAGSSIIQACTVYRQTPNNWIFDRRNQVPANALGFLLVNLTPTKVDPNGKPFVQVDETFTGTHTTRTFQGTTLTVLATVITGVETLILAQLLQLEVPGPRIRVFFGRVAKVATVNALTQSISIDVSIIAASDAGPNGRFVVSAQAVQTQVVKS